MRLLHHIRITPQSIILDGKEVEVQGEGLDLLRNAYQAHIGGYPKFHKMDGLCKLGLVASDLLLQAESSQIIGEDRSVQGAELREDRAVILFNRGESVPKTAVFPARLSSFIRWRIS